MTSADPSALLEAGFRGGAEAWRLASAVDVALPLLWRRLAGQLIATLPQRGNGCTVLGISGGQGAGKSTLGRAICESAAAAGLKAAVLSLDDLYRTAEDRLALGHEVHPLLVTRGVPGTHELALVWRLLEQLGAAQIRFPRFDKGADDRVPAQAFPVISGPLDLLVFEGWCLGVSPEPEARLETPINVLEAQEDRDGRYRRYVNDQIAEHYQPLWARLDQWLYLSVPDQDAVRRWRGQQERAIPDAQRMSAAQLERFLAHYERLTRWLKETAPGQADWTLELDSEHGLAGLLRGSERVQPLPLE